MKKQGRIQRRSRMRTVTQEAKSGVETGKTRRVRGGRMPGVKTGARRRVKGRRKLWVKTGTRRVRGGRMPGVKTGARRELGFKIGETPILSQAVMRILQKIAYFTIRYSSLRREIMKI